MVNKLHVMEDALNKFFIEREDEVHGLSLALLSGANTLFIGPPGTGKTLLVNSWAQLINNNTHFSWLLHKFMTPDELFGPISLEGLKNERFVRNTKNKLPEATTCFLDEIYKCNAGSLNALLSVLNERLFHNDGEETRIPLMSVIGASNELPEESDNLDALDDRFSLRYYVRPVKEHGSKIKMYNNADTFSADKMVSLDEITKMRKEVATVEVPDSIADIVVGLISSLRGEGINITDRTFKNSRRLLQAEAYYNGKDTVDEACVELLCHSFWRDEKQQPIAHKIILRKVSPEKQQVIELYEDAEDVFTTAMATKDPKKRSEEGLEAASKLKTAKKEIHEHLSNMKKANKPIKDLLELESQLETWIEEVFKLCGVDFYNYPRRQNNAKGWKKIKKYC
ncbi:MAG: AAA family ATPase [Rhodobacteraceae bacterium]|nr:AAA family ATPase [Paracoccaceae bacterium]